MEHLSQPRIVCAAIRLSDGDLLIGPRHWDMVMVRQMNVKMMSLNLSAGEENYLVDGETQGFIDQHGVFYDRYEAWEIAEANGQIINRRPGCEGPELFSENLY